MQQHIIPKGVVALLTSSVTTYKPQRCHVPGDPIYAKVKLKIVYPLILRAMTGVQSMRRLLKIAI